MLERVARWGLAAAMLLAVSGCGFDTSATFNVDGSVTVGLKFLFPRSLMQGTNGATVSGFSPSEIAADNARLQASYPGASVTVVTEGEASGALVSIPFKTEKAAFDFLIAPSQLSPSGATSGTGMRLNLSNTGGLFSSASHTTSGGTDTYTFKTAPPPPPSPSPGQTQVISGDEVSSIFVITFSLTVPHPISSAPGALFTIDHKTAIWKLSWTQSQTLTATTGPDASLVANVSKAPDWRVIALVAIVAVAVGVVLGMLMPWRVMQRTAPPPSG